MQEAETQGFLRVVYRTRAETANHHCCAGQIYVLRCRKSSFVLLKCMTRQKAYATKIPHAKNIHKPPPMARDQTHPSAGRCPKIRARCPELSAHGSRVCSETLPTLTPCGYYLFSFVVASSETRQKRVSDRDFIRTRSANSSRMREVITHTL